MGKILIQLPEKLHQRVRVAAAMSMQDMKAICEQPAVEAIDKRTSEIEAELKAKAERDKKKKP